MSKRLLLLTLLAAPACTIPYPYSPYAQNGANGSNGSWQNGGDAYGPNSASAVTEDGTVVVVVIDPAALAQVTADARRTGQNVVQLHVGNAQGTPAWQLGNSANNANGSVATARTHEEQTEHVLRTEPLSELAARETGSIASSNAGNETHSGWSRGTGTELTTQQNTATGVSNPTATTPANPTPANTAVQASNADPVKTEKPLTNTVSQPRTVSQPANTGVSESTTSNVQRAPSQNYAPVSGSSWWAPIGLVKKATGNN